MASVSGRRGPATQGDGRPGMPKLQVPLDAVGLRAAASGSAVQVMVEVERTAPGFLEGWLLEPTGRSRAARRVRRSGLVVQVRWSQGTEVVMGARDSLVVGAVLRVHGTLREYSVVSGDLIAVMTGHVDVAERICPPGGDG
jgi:hypothetical protein